MLDGRYVGLFGVQGMKGGALLGVLFLGKSWLYYTFDILGSDTVSGGSLDLM